MNSDNKDKKKGVELNEKTYAARSLSKKFFKANKKV